MELLIFFMDFVHDGSVENGDVPVHRSPLNVYSY